MTADLLPRRSSSRSAGSNAGEDQRSAERTLSFVQPGTPATGQIRTHIRRDGLTTFSLRLRVDGTRHTIRLGTEAEGGSHVRAELELATRDPRGHLDAGTYRPVGR